MAINVAPLPLYPQNRARKALSPSTSANLNQAIASAVSQVLELPPEKRDIPATRDFISSYVKDAALQSLESLIWGENANPNQPTQSRDEKAIRQRTLLLAEKLALTKNQNAVFDVQTLLDLSIVYSPTNSSRVRALFSSAVESNRSLLSNIASEVVPAFTALLSPSEGTVVSGLYGIRKASHCLRSLLLPSPPEAIRLFALNKPFMLALAKAYDHSLSTIAALYGGFDLSEDAPNSSDQTIFVETKVAFIDCFNVLVGKGLLNDIVFNKHPDIEQIFDVLFELVELQPSSPTGSTPYLNRSLIADYQDAYDLSRMVTTALKKAHSEDARIDLLESQLDAITPGGTARRQPGALKLLLHSSGVPLVGIDLKGKGKAIQVPVARPAEGSLPYGDLDIQVTQVLDIFPDQSTEHIRALLEHPDYPFKGDPERVIGALLEGTAPALEDLIKPSAGDVEDYQREEEFSYTQGRRNVFDSEVVDVESVRVGKKIGDAASILGDRSFMEKMKADILRRVEEFSDDDEDAEGQDEFEEDIDGAVGVKVAGDGEESEDDQEEGEEAKPKMLPETICELAYIQDPKLFDRDGQTRRSKARADLKAQTGWSDEQLEGWRIMLERDPKKDKILQKHEFAGNKAGPVHSTLQEGESSRSGGNPRGRGRGRGRGGGPPGGGGDARARAQKDKKGNQQRKRGHDKKMAKTGAVPT